MLTYNCSLWKSCWPTGTRNENPLIIQVFAIDDAPVQTVHLFSVLDWSVIPLGTLWSVSFAEKQLASFHSAMPNVKSE